MNIIKKDAEFFRSHEIIDYSLLIGVIKKDNVEDNRKSRPLSKLIQRESLDP